MRRVATDFSPVPGYTVGTEGGGDVVIYLDGIVGLNFLVDWLLLLGVNRLSGFPPGIGRTAAAAAVGGSYAGICLVPGFAFLGTALWRGVSLGLISMTAFGLDRTALRRGVLFVLLSMALGGLALCADSGSVAELLLCAGGLTMLCTLGFRHSPGSQRFQTAQLTHQGRTITLNALVDTGNTLRDPITGEPVLIVDAYVARELLDLTADALTDPTGLLQANPGRGLRLIPYQTVGQKGSLLPALRCESVLIGGKKTGGLVAFAPVVFGNGEYHALTGGD